MGWEPTITQVNAEVASKHPQSLHLRTLTIPV